MQTGPPLPLECLSSPPLVASVLITPNCAESPGSYGTDRCVGYFFHLRPSRINFTLPGRPSSALEHSVKKITSQNVWPRINSNLLMNELTPREAQFQKTARSADFFLQRQPRNFENTILVPRRRKHFQGFLAIFLVAQLSPKRGVLVHKNSLASCQRCHHSVKPRALTCPFKHSDRIA